MTTEQERLIDIENPKDGDYISRQEAIDNIRQLYIDLAIQKYIIDLLKILPSVTPQESCDDAISRQAVLDLCDKKDRYNLPYEYDKDGKHVRGWDEGRIINVTKLKQLPSVAIPSADIEQAYMKGREDGVNDFIKKSLIDE